MRLPPFVKTSLRNRLPLYSSPKLILQGDCDFDCTVCENPCRPLGSCRVCWDDPSCLVRKEDCLQNGRICRAGCAAAKTAAEAACDAGTAGAGLAACYAAAQAAKIYCDSRCAS
jgi:hypothetical protein